MAYFIRTASGEIKTYMEAPAGTVLETGETWEETPLTFEAFSNRLRLSVDGVGGELVQVPTGSGMAHVQVDCPGESSVMLDINGLVEGIPLVNGKGTLALSSELPGTYVITPADRKKFCAAGESLCVVEVSE